MIKKIFYSLQYTHQGCKDLFDERLATRCTFNFKLKLTSKTLWQKKLNKNSKLLEIVKFLSMCIRLEYCWYHSFMFNIFPFLRNWMITLFFSFFSLIHFVNCDCFVTNIFLHKFSSQLQNFWNNKKVYCQQYNRKSPRRIRGVKSSLEKGKQKIN